MATRRVADAPMHKTVKRRQVVDGSACLLDDLLVSLPTSQNQRCVKVNVNSVITVFFEALSPT
jgi:hypothetical protein